VTRFPPAACETFGVPGSAGRCGSPFEPLGGFGVGFGLGVGVGPPQVPTRCAFSAWTSTSWPPAHGAALCGWLLPGPCRTVLGFAPLCIAIPPAVWPFPYCFVSFDDAGACVSCAVVFEGLTPSAGAGSAAVVVVVAAVVVAAGGASFFTCPGAFAELPGAASVPFPFPFPLPASAEPANAKIPRTSTHVPVSRILILPLPHVSR
jgi:hypothetical protein